MDFDREAEKSVERGKSARDKGVSVFSLAEEETLELGSSIARQPPSGLSAPTRRQPS